MERRRWKYTHSKFSGGTPLGFQVHSGVEKKRKHRNIKIAERFYHGGGKKGTAARMAFFRRMLRMIAI